VDAYTGSDGVVKEFKSRTLVREDMNKTKKLIKKTLQ
jgi:hypothetical protein